MLEQGRDVIHHLRLIDVWARYYIMTGKIIPGYMLRDMAAFAVEGADALEVEMKKPKVSTGSDICSVCHAHIEPEHVFCPQCGHKIWRERQHD